MTISVNTIHFLKINKTMKKRNHKKYFNRVSAQKTVMKVIIRNQRDQYGVDSTAMMVMEGLEGRVSQELLHMMTSMMLGMNDDMQLEIADDLLDFACDHVVHITGCPTADALLKTCYTWIAEEQGFEMKIKL